MPIRANLFIAIAVAGTAMVSTTHASDNVFGKDLARECPATMAWLQAHAKHAGNQKSDSAPDAKRHYTEPAWRAELISRAIKDQNIRHAWIASHYNNPSTEAMLAVDANNLSWLKPFIANHAFPTIKQVGQKGVHDAWLLVQHATKDPTFQARVLRDIAPKLGAAGISKQDYAMLKDRVLLEQGKQQVYGSQWHFNKKAGSLSIRPLRDPAHVNQRRASMGLMPLRDYKCMLKIMYMSSPSTESQAVKKP